MPSPEELDRALAEKLDDLGQTSGWQKALRWARKQHELEAERSGKRKSNKTSRETLSGEQELSHGTGGSMATPEELDHAIAEKIRTCFPG
jgi:hypothetical protein